MVSIVGARCFAPDIGHAQRAPTMQGAQKLRSATYLQVRCMYEVAAQRSRWTFYETIKINRRERGDRREEWKCKNKNRIGFFQPCSWHDLAPRSPPALLRKVFSRGSCESRLLRHSGESRNPAFYYNPRFRVAFRLPGMTFSLGSRGFECTSLVFGYSVFFSAISACSAVKNIKERAF